MTTQAEIPPQSVPGVAWVPLPMQARALECGAYELFLGGCASPGKSEYLVVAPLRWVGEPTFRAVLFRNTYVELHRTLIEKSRRYYPALGGTYNESKHVWTFPRGAQVEFSYLEADRDVHRYQGAEFQFVGFDELPHFTEYQYTYLQSRLRGAAGIPIRLRATGNPDGPHLEWVRRRFAPWIDKKAAAGDVLWFGPDGVRCERGTPDSLSRSYVPGLPRDNPYLGPEYWSQLMTLDPVTRARILDGDWDAVAGEGKLFNRAWWVYFDAAPRVLRRCRAWDLGAGGDPTEGVLLGDRGAKEPSGIAIVPRWVVLDCVTHVGPPHEVHALVARTAEADGRDVVIRLPQDPGQAGKDQAQTFVRELAGYRVVTAPVVGDKQLRAGPFSSQVGARNVGIVRAPWTPGFVAQLHSFPDTERDDKVDAAGDAFKELSGGSSFYAERMRAAVDRQLPPTRSPAVVR